MIAATVPAAVAHMNFNDVARTSRSRSSEREDEQDPVNRKNKHREQFYAALAEELSTSVNSSVKISNNTL